MMISDKIMKTSARDDDDNKGGDDILKLVHPCHHHDHLDEHQPQQVGVETAELPSDPKPPYISPGGCYISPT